MKGSTNLFLTVLSLFILAVIGYAQDPSAAKPAATPDVREIKQSVSKIGLGNDVTIKRKDGQGFSGAILKVADESVTVADVGLKANIQIPYNEIQDITAGPGTPKPWNGKAPVSHKHRTFAIVMIAIGVLVPIVITASRSSNRGLSTVP
jgi:hypothetical protein